MVYQLMFAIITPALITGAFAERMKFSAMAVFLVAVVGAGVLSDGAHGVGRGRTAERNGRAHSKPGLCRRHGGACDQRRFGADDVRFTWANGSGIRNGMPPHSMVLSFIGACLLWVGWFGFNAGSALGRDPAGDKRVCEHALRGGGGGSGMDAAEWIHNGKPTALGAISGAVAGWWPLRRPRGLCSPWRRC
jgi:Amt family ammonium transporter